MRNTIKLDDGGTEEFDIDKDDFVSYNKKKRKSTITRELIAWLETIVVAVVIVSLIITFVGRMMRVEGSSMTPTLLHEERIITTPLYTTLEYGDIVVIRRRAGQPIIKRIIGTPGDTVDIDFDTHEVSVNGKALDEPYINEPTQREFDVTFPVTVPENHYFVMGDNRNNSDDSRHSEIGMIDKRNIFGKAVFRLWPLDRLGSIDSGDYSGNAKTDKSPS